VVPFSINRYTVPDQSIFNLNSTGWIINAETSDEFNGTTLDPFKWSALNNNCHGSLELSYYRPYNVSVNNGRLILSYQYEPVSEPCGTYSQHYEVDYVRSYKLQHGINGLYWPGAIGISDPNISKVHRDIQLGGDNNHLGYFPSSTKLNFRANNSITLDKSVEIPSGDGITFRIVQTDPDCYISNNTFSNE